MKCAFRNLIFLVSQFLAEVMICTNIDWPGDMITIISRALELFCGEVGELRRAVDCFCCIFSWLVP